MPSRAILWLLYRLDIQPQPSSHVVNHYVVQSSALEQSCSKHCTTKETSSNRQASPTTVAITVGPTVRSRRPDDPHVRICVWPVSIRVIAICTSRRKSSPGRLDIYIAALLVLAKELRFSGLDGFHERLSCTKMSKVGLALLLGASCTALLALVVCLTRDLVLELARELGEALGLLRSRSSSSSLGCRAWRQVIMVRVFGGQVFQRHCPMHPAVLLALLGAQRAEILLVVVGVHPDAARGIAVGVDEELVALLRVE
jgi:hypothetical protein